MTISHLRGGVAVIGTATELATANPVLLQRQLSLETDTGVEKIGDGTTHYNDISPVPGATGGSSYAYGGWLYGDGSDGALTLHDGDLLHPGFYTDVTIVAGATVRLAPYFTRIPVVHCTGTWTINGTLDLSGADATGGHSTSLAGVADSISNGPGQAPRMPAILSAPFNGGAGGTGASGAPMPNSPDVYGNTDVAVDTTVLDLMRLLAWVPAGIIYAITDYGFGSPGSGDGTNYGGAGGGPGNVFALLARHLVHGPDSAYNIQGGAGGDGGDNGSGSLGHGDCGGGGGGAGGWWLTVSDTIVGSTATNGIGGAGGAGCGTGTDGEPGVTGRGIHLLNRA